MHVEKSPVCQGIKVVLYGKSVLQAAKVSNLLRMRAGSWAAGSLCEQELLINHTECLESLGHCHCKYNSADPSSNPTIFHIYFVSVWRLFQQFFWEVEISVTTRASKEQC